MKAVELMIGDWVHFLGKEEYGKDRRIKVTSITESKNEDDNDYFTLRCYDPVIIDFGTYGFNIEPIPITPKILKKNGFSISEFYKSIWIEKSECYIEIRKTSEGWIFDTVNGGNHIIILMHNIHELQHALRFAGINKEIIL